MTTRPPVPDPNVPGALHTIPGIPPADSLEALIAGIEAAGVAVDSEAALSWLRGVAEAAATPDEFAVAADHGLGGHELALLDFEPATAERLRQIGSLIAAPPVPGVRTALAISGSAAQGRI